MNEKSEIRISKFETNPNVQILNFLNHDKIFVFWISDFEHLKLFRASDFDIRI